LQREDLGHVAAGSRVFAAPLFSKPTSAGLAGQRSFSVVDFHLTPLFDGVDQTAARRLKNLVCAIGARSTGVFAKTNDEVGKILVEAAPQ
jgi:hypothetical protein